MALGKMDLTFGFRFDLVGGRRRDGWEEECVT